MTLYFLILNLCRSGCIAPFVPPWASLSIHQDLHSISSKAAEAEAAHAEPHPPGRKVITSQHIHCAISFATSAVTVLASLSLLLRYEL